MLNLQIHSHIIVLDSVIMSTTSCVVYILAHESNLHSKKHCLLISTNNTAEFSAVGLYNHVAILITLLYCRYHYDNYDEMCCVNVANVNISCLGTNINFIVLCCIYTYMQSQ